MDDDDDTALAVSNRHPRKAWSDSKAFRRLQRELRGGDLRWDPRFHKPAETYCETPDRSEHVYWLTSSKRVLKSVRLDLLHGQHELRDYIVGSPRPIEEFFFSRGDLRPNKYRFSAKNRPSPIN